MFLAKTADFEQASALARIPLERTGTYNELWLQTLIARHPSLLPIDQIEPALVPAVSICTELSVSSGYIDNLYATARGDIIVAETKLWRNPEARREVIGQILDYAKDLSAMTYEAFDAAIKTARSRGNSASDPQKGLFDAVVTAGNPDLEEAQFIDAVFRNLRRGRFLLLVVGDGIREGVENISSFLQQHAGLHFTLALVEMGIFEIPNAVGGLLVQPRILVKTVNIERGIVIVNDGHVSIGSPQPPLPSNQTIAATKKLTITAERFYEDLARVRPDLPAKLKQFVEKLELLKIVPEFGTSSLILRWRPSDDTAWNLGSIVKDGKIWTEIVHSQADAVGLLNLSQELVAELAAIVPGAYVKKTSPKSWHADKDGTYIYVSDLLEHEDKWFEALQSFTRKANEALARSS